MMSEGEVGSASIYVEERVKLLKNGQFNQVYKSLKELCKQIKEFKSYYLLSSQNRQDLFKNKKEMKKKL